MIGAAEVEVDKETGNIELIDYVAVVDCGTPINPNLARVQTEGGVSQGIGMALMENVQYSKEGKIRENSFMQYKIPSRVDIGNIRVEFESSYEKSGPFGAKSIGELVIDTPCPAIADAVYNASGVRVRELPITPEKVARERIINDERCVSGMHRFYSSDDDIFGGRQTCVSGSEIKGRYFPAADPGISGVLCGI